MIWDGKTWGGLQPAPGFSRASAWYRTVKRSTWKSIMDVRQNHPHADEVGPFTVFNIGGNKCRLITKIHYRAGMVYIKHVLTHPEYDRGGWKR